jgi:hypothetical protein
VVNVVGWILLAVIVIWFLILYRHSHSKRLHLDCYITFLLLHDEFRCLQKRNFEEWLRTNRSNKKPPVLSHAAYTAIEELADRLAVGNPKKGGEGSLVLGSLSLLWNHRDLIPCPECGSTLGVYTVLALPSYWSDDAERRERRNLPVKAGDFGPCKYCFHGLIYDDSGGSLRLRQVSGDEIIKSKIIRPGQLSLRPDDPAAHVAKDVEVVVMNHGLGITEGTPEKNQQGLMLDALQESGRLLSKDAESEVLPALMLLSFEATRDLYLGLFSERSDDDKRKLLLSIAKNSK